MIETIILINLKPDNNNKNNYDWMIYQLDILLQ